MILFFSGTGNSEYVAKRIGAKTEDEIVSIGEILKDNQKIKLSTNNSPYIFVCPTYAWGMPKPVTEFIKSTEFAGNNQVYFILTCGGETGNTIGSIRKLCEEKNWTLRGFAEVKLPDNYIIMFSDTSEAEAKKMLRDAEPIIQKISQQIKNGKKIEFNATIGFVAKLKSGLVNSLFNKFYLTAKGFRSTDKCTGCGSCVQLCALNNIEIKDKKPYWGGNCTHCMACISNCPVYAIEYKDKTQGKTRYNCFNYTDENKK